MSPTFEFTLFFLVPVWVFAGVVAYFRQRDDQQGVLRLQPSPRRFPRPGPHPHGTGGPLSLRNLAFGLLMLPPLLLTAVLSIPFGWIRKFVVERSERRFAKQMKLAGRLKSWNEIQGFVVSKTGTLICEQLSIKGPSRLWWTADNIPEISPFPYATSNNRTRICYEAEFRPFGKWCFQQYTSPSTGKAFLVDLPATQRRNIWRQVLGAGCISTYSREASEAS